MKQLIKPTAYLTISNVLTRALGMLFFVVLARMLSVSDYGLFRYLITIATLYGILFTGFPVALTKNISKNKQDKETSSHYFSNTLWLMILVFIVLSLIISIFQDNVLYIILFLFFVFIDAFYTGLIRGILDYTKLFLFKLNENLIQLIALVIFYLIYKGINLSYAVLFYSFSGLASLIILELIRKSNIKLYFKASKEKIKQIIKYSIPVMMGSIGWTIMFGINMVFIEHFFGTEQVGYFSVGTTLVQVFTFIPMALSTILMPKVASLEDRKSLNIKRLIIYNFVISIIILIFLLVFDKFIINLLFGSKYLPVTPTILYLSLGQIFISSHLIYASFWQGIEKPGIPSIIISICAVLNVVGSYLLTPLYGIIGASISNAITSLVVLLISIVVFQKNGNN